MSTPSDERNDLKQVRQLALEVAEREGCVLYDLELVDGPRRALRIYIDRVPGGVSLEDCVNVSKGMNLRLDVEDAMPGGAYELEVSSPGLERRLTQAWHFGTAIDQIVRLQFRDADGMIKPYEGKLTAVNGQHLAFENSKGPWIVEFENVQKARVVLKDAFQKKPAPGKKKR